MTSKTDYAMQQQLTEILTAGITDDAMKAIDKQVKTIASNIEEDVLYTLKSELGSTLASWVAGLAGKVVNAMLEGSEEEMRRYLSCEAASYNGRSGDHNIYGRRNISEQHQIIHGKLFEQGCIALRRKIVDAHRDLLVNERILDLEDQVKSLVAQCNKSKAEQERRAEEDRNYREDRAPF